MRIQNNMMAMNTQRNLSLSAGAGAKSMGKLSSGYRINSAADDAAGLSISEKMRAQIRGLGQASRNSQDGISMIQTAEGALAESQDILQRMRELAVQSSTDTNTAADRVEIQKEVDQLAKEVTRISNTTEFNTKNLMAGGLNTTFHIGANASQNVEFSVSAMDAKTLGVAASQVVAGAFTTGTSGITGTSSYGRGLSTQNYTVTTTKSAASVGASSGTMTDVGDFSGVFTGDSSLSVQVRIDTVAAGAVSAFSYSTDGANWTSVASDTGTIGSTGLTWTADAAATYIAGDEGKILTATATAALYTAKLVDAGGADVGAAVQIRHSATSAVIGNGATGENLTISFTNGGIAAQNTASQVITEIGSAAAVTNADGSVQSDATVAAGINVSTQTSANTAITTINSAIETVSAERSKLGAMQNRLEHTIKNLDTSAENMQSAESRIRDVDMAKEMMEFTKDNILQQAATAMLAQANQAPEAVLQLLR